MKLIDKTISVDVNSFEAAVFETNEKLEEFFGLSLNELAITENSKLMGKVEKIHEEHLDKLIELIFQTIKKGEEFNSEINFETKELSKKLCIVKQ